MTDKSPQFGFIVGCGHSGTSLLAAMLGAHSEIYAITRETRSFRRGLTPEKIRERLETMAAGRPKKDVAYIFEKTPRHIHSAKQIWAVFPDARIVGIIRDPRDTIASLNERLGDLDLAIGRWRDDNAKLRAIRLDPRAFVLKFEDLVLGPAAVLEKLCAFLGLPYEPTMLDYWKEERDWFAADKLKDARDEEELKHRALRSWQLRQPIMTDRVGAYRKQLSDAEVAEITRRLTAFAAQFGYDISAKAPA